jgi:hypothetical protein
MRDDAAGTEKAKRSRAEGSLIPDVSTWLSSTSDALEGWAQSNHSMTQGAFDIVREMLSFSRTRLQADMDAWKALVACRSAGDLFGIQNEYAKTGTAQYFYEANKLTTLLTRVMASAGSQSWGSTKKP